MSGSAVPAVLVIDDEHVTRKVLELRLQSAGFFVVPVPTATEGLQKIAERDFDVIILDLLLPDLNGPEVVEALAKSKPHMVERVIVLSALDDAARKKYPTPGVYAEFRKPLDHKTLIDLVRLCANRDSDVAEKTGEQI